MVHLNSLGMVADIPQSFQIELKPVKESLDLCVPWAVSALLHSGAPGTGPKGNAEDIDRWADAEADKWLRGGHLGALGSTPQQLQQFLKDAHLPAIQVPPTIENIKIALGAGIPVLVNVYEKNVISEKTGKVAYPWSLPDAEHTFPIGGINHKGNLLCPDQLNNKYQNEWPCVYIADRLKPIAVYLVCMPWLVSTLPGFDPTKWPKGFNAQQKSEVKNSMVPDEPGVQVIPTANSWDRRGLKPLYIILHGTSDLATPQQIMSYMASTAKLSPDKQVSCHYCIGKDGTIVQGVSESLAAWANGPISGPPGVSGDGLHHDAWWSQRNINPNLLTIAIEFVKANGNLENITDAQKSAGFRLIQHICERHGIPKRQADTNGGITGHFSIDPALRSHCPGTFPYADLWTFLKGTGTTTIPVVKPPTIYIPHNWTYKDGILLAPNNPNAIKMFAPYILSRSTWDGDHNTPEEPEQEVNNLEMTNQGLGPGTQQVFTKSMLGLQKGKDPTKDVIDEYIGREFLKLHQEYQILQTLVTHDRDQIALLQNQNGALNNQVVSLQQQLQAFQGVQQQNVDFQTQVTELQQQLLALSPEHIQALEAQVAQLQQELTQLQGEAQIIEEVKKLLGIGVAT